MNTIYPSLSTNLAEGTVFRKHTVCPYLLPCYFGAKYSYETPRTKKGRGTWPGSGRSAPWCIDGSNCTRNSVFAEIVRPDLKKKIKYS